MEKMRNPVLVKIIMAMAFIGLTTVNFEYLVNRQSSTILFVLAIAIEIVLVYFLLLPLLKNLLK